MNYPVYIDVTESNKIEIPLREVKRYLGYGRVEMTPEVTSVAQELIDETRKIMRPRACYTRLAVTFMDYPRMDLGFGIVESKHLWKNLSDGSLFDLTAPAGAASSEKSDPDTFTSKCQPVPYGSVSGDFSVSNGASLNDSSECFLLAATIGPQMDVQIRRLARTSPSKSVILQAIGAAAIEAYCDLLEVRMAAEVAEEGLALLPRFSPGYGDFSLAHQRDFFRVLDPPRRAGITLTDQLLMVPEKSVTAVIGLTNQKINACRGNSTVTENAGIAFSNADTKAVCRQDRDASKNKCAACSNRECTYRNL